VTLQRAGGAAGFSASADAYAATMAPALRPVAREVIRRAALQPDESVLDIGTGATSYLAAHTILEFLGHICAQPRWQGQRQERAETRRLADSQLRAAGINPEGHAR